MTFSDYKLKIILFPIELAERETPDTSKMATGS